MSLRLLMGVLILGGDIENALDFRELWKNWENTHKEFNGSKSQFLYQDWFCTYPQSLFQTNPIQVLTEFLKVLENIK